MNTVASEPVREVSRKWKPYPSYKDSGIEWLGRIPAHWETMPLKRAVECPVARGVGQELPFVALEHIVGGEGRLVPGFEWETADASDCATFRAGDVPYGKLRPYLRKYLQVDRDGCCPTELLVLRPATDDCSNRFLCYLVQSQPFVALTEATSYGVKMPRTAWEDLSPCWVWLPSLSEQRAIAAFLDRETAKIDSLISAKERQIQLLREKRMAIISQAVTRGLDPNAPLKDSGIEWLGDIPAHWEVRKMKYLVSARLRYGLSESGQLDDSSCPRFVRIADISDDGSLRSDVFASLPWEIAEPCLLDDGDILFARSGATVGKTFQYKDSWGTCCFAGYLILCRADSAKVEPDFLYYVTKSDAYLSWIKLILIQSTIENVSAEKYAGFVAAVPPLPEQRAIAAFLDRETAKIDALISRIQEHIERLREYRIALISAAVTGQIDVREEV